MSHAIRKDNVTSKNEIMRLMKNTFIEAMYNNEILDKIQCIELDIDSSGRNNT